MARLGRARPHRPIILFVTGNTSVPQSDTGSGADATVSFNATLAQSDTGSGADSQSVNTGLTPISDGDTGTGTDGWAILATLPSSNDNVFSAEAKPIIGQTFPETGSGADAQTIAISGTQTDTGTGADSQTILVTFTQTDTGTGTDALVSAGPNTNVPKPVSDTWTSLDAVVIHVTHPAPGSPQGLTRIGTWAMQQRMADMSRNKIPRPLANRRWPRIGGL